MFYVYAHCNPIDKRPFYVGKGNGIRANSRTGRSEEWAKIVDGLLKVGLTFEVKILHVCEESDDALRLEKAEIKALMSQGYILINKHVNTTEDTENVAAEGRVKTEARRLKQNIAEAVSEALDKKLETIYKKFRAEVSEQLLENIRLMGVDSLLKTQSGGGRRTAQESERRFLLFSENVTGILRKNNNVPIRRKLLIEQAGEYTSYAYLALNQMVTRGILKEEKADRQQMLYSLAVVPQ
jgi:ribosomal protein S20